MSNSFSNQVIAQLELFTAATLTRTGSTSCPSTWREGGRLHVAALGASLTELTGPRRTTSASPSRGPSRRTAPLRRWSLEPGAWSLEPGDVEAGVATPAYLTGALRRAGALPTGEVLAVGQERNPASTRLSPTST